MKIYTKVINRSKIVINKPYHSLNNLLSAMLLVFDEKELYFYVENLSCIAFCFAND